MLYVPPAREVKPTVGLRPTILFLSLGEIIEPSVSVPKAPAASPMAEHTPLPELEPDGLPFTRYGLVHCPPRPENPAGTLPRMADHSLRDAFPRRMAPAERSLAATIASRGTTDPTSASEPAVVFIPIEYGV